MKYFRIIVIGLLLCAILAVLALGNLWRFMPEFHVLDTFFTFPLYIQILFLVFSVISGSLLFREKFDIKIFSVFILFLLLTITSSYKVVISNNVNSITVSLDPFYTKEIRFHSINTVKYQGNKVLLNTKSELYTIYTGWYPVGVDTKSLKDAFYNFGDCIDKTEKQCVEIEFSWP